MVNKKVVIIISLIAIIVTGAIVYFSVRPFQKIKYTFGEEEFETTSSIIADNKENKKNEENEKQDESLEEDSEPEEEQKSESKDEKKSEEKETPKKTGKELAIELAKKEWGESDTSVYYYVEEQKSDDIYIISVRNRETTAGMMDYEVNIKTETVEEY